MQNSLLNYLGGTFSPLLRTSLDPINRVGHAVIEIPESPKLKKWQRSAKLNGKDAKEPGSDGSGRKTRLDMDFGELLVSDGQYIDVKIVLPAKLYAFLNDGLAITTQNPAGSNAFFNLDFLDQRTVNFACVYTDAQLIPYPRYNIMFVITDEGNSIYSLPVIIDPAIRNRG